MDKNQLQNPVRKYLIGIIACELLLLTMWIELGSDMDVARSVGVKTLLEQTTNGVQEKTDIFLASIAIRDASRNIKLFTFIVIVDVLTVAGLTILTAYNLRRSRDTTVSEK
jgi:hypothetical protein